MRASTIVLSGLTAAAAAAALWLGMRLSEERARSGELSAELLQLRAHRSGERPAQPAVEAPPSAVATPQSATIRAEFPAPNAASQVELGPEFPPASARAWDLSETRRRLLDNPAYRKAMRAQQRLMIEQRYRDLPKALGISPDQADQVFELMAEQSMSSMESSMHRVKSREDSEALTRAFMERQRTSESQMTELLGTSNMAKLQDFRQSMQSRAEVRMLGNELIGTSDPLREDQMEPLFNAMYTEQKRLQQEWSDLTMSGQNGPAMGAKRSQLAIAANARIVDSAGSLLSGSQLNALKEMYRRQKLQMEAQDEMNRLTREATPRPKAGRPD